MLYSIYDKQQGKHLETGLNSTSKKDAINQAIDYLVSANDFSAPSMVKRMNLKFKEIELNMNDFVIEEHTERYTSYFDI